MTDREKIEEAFREADEACEGENYHDRCGLAHKIYESVEDLIPKPSRVRAARRIAKEVSP